jgi:sec-independent protein translocase protein TatB
MFDITSSKLLLLAIVALLVIGPKDLPGLLRTIGKYMGIIKRQAAEFRSQFDEAMRESELAELKKEVETIQSETESSMRAAEQSLEKEFDTARQGVDAALAEGEKPKTEALAHDSGQPPEPPVPGEEPAKSLNGSGHAPTDASTSAPEEPAVEPRRTPEKSQA